MRAGDSFGKGSRGGDGGSVAGESERSEGAEMKEVIKCIFKKTGGRSGRRQSSGMGNGGSDANRVRAGRNPRLRGRRATGACLNGGARRNVNGVDGR